MLPIIGPAPVLHGSTAPIRYERAPSTTLIEFIAPDADHAAESARVAASADAVFAAGSVFADPATECVYWFANGNGVVSVPVGHGGGAGS